MISLRRLLLIGDTPHRTALAFGIGLFIAFFPLFGFHTIIALGIAFAFRLDRVAILVGAYVNNPWTFAPLYLVGTLLGCRLLGVPISNLSTEMFDESGAAGTLADRLLPFLWPYVIGNLLLGVVAGALGYLALRRILERRRAAKLARAGASAG